MSLRVIRKICRLLKHPLKKHIIQKFVLIWLVLKDNNNIFFYLDLIYILIFYLLYRPYSHLRYLSNKLLMLISKNL
jgi:hypothetical protein